MKLSNEPNRVPFLLCIDVEPNDREVGGDPAADWSATRPVIDRIEIFRAELQSRLRRPVHVNWFIRMDPQITDAYGSGSYIYDRLIDCWRDSRDAGDGFGIHVHAWRKLDDDSWLSDVGNDQWVQHCVLSSMEVFSQCFGAGPKMFRFGDRFLSNAVVRLLARRGVRFDLTVEPGMPPMKGMRGSEHSTGSLPDYRHAPREPYRPSRLDYRKPGRWLARKLLMIPVSTGCADREQIRPKRSIGFANLNLALDHGQMKQICEGLLLRPDLSHICWVARTGDYAFTEYRLNFEANLDYLAGSPSAERFSFIRPEEVWGE